MSWLDAPRPDTGEAACNGVELVISPRSRDIGDFEVRRALPSGRRRMVGPFIFFDEMGPAHFDPGHGLDVRPHPHIGLATITYLFEGEIMHRDSLGNALPIRPGAVNWMTAGGGIVHSERSPDVVRRDGGTLWGIQAWVALPRAYEDAAPAFEHYPAERLPGTTHDGVDLRLIAGTLGKLTSPVKTHSDLLYADVRLEAGAQFMLPAEHAERAVYVVHGEIEITGQAFAAGQLLVLRGGLPITLDARSDAHVMLLGGAPMDGERHIWWNFVGSTTARIEAAKARWRDGGFPPVPGDDEFIPLPD